MEDETAADERHPRGGLCGSGSFAFPSDAEVGEEIVAGPALFGNGLVVTGAVVADCGAGDDEARARRDLVERTCETAGGEDAAGAERGLAMRRPALVADALAGEVDDDVGIREV